MLLGGYMGRGLGYSGREGPQPSLLQGDPSSQPLGKLRHGESLGSQEISADVATSFTSPLAERMGWVWLCPGAG